MISGSS